MGGPSVAAMSPVHHTIDYIEINTSDLAVSRAFYEQAFGWTFNDYGPTYAGIRAASGDGEVGGLNGTGTPGPGGPLVLLFSDDLDATVARLWEAGAAFRSDVLVGRGGRQALLQDPAGNLVELFQAG